MKIFTSLVIFLLITTQLFGQQQAGAWKDYLSYSNAIKVADAGDKVFCATEGGLFYVDKDDNSLNKVTGLSDFGIKTIAYNSEEELLIVAYQNANIDIIRAGRVINLSDIKRKTISADKTIHNISFNGSEAYISCGFGIVVLNLEKQEVKDTYIIGDEGLPMPVYDVDFFQNRIYAATEEGILWAPDDDTNLLDYSNWVEEVNVPHAGDPFTLLAVHSGLLIANYSAGESTNDEAYAYDGNSWSAYFASLRVVLELESDYTYLTFTGSREIVLFDQNHSNIGKINSYQFEDEHVAGIRSNSTAVSEDGTIWIADQNRALIRFNGSNFEALQPYGPPTNDVFDLEIANSVVYISSGGRTDVWNNRFMQPRFQRYDDGQWKNFSSPDIPELTGFWDIVSVAVDPFDESHLFIASWGGGVIEFRNDEFVNRYYNLNSPLESALPDQPNEPYTRIGGLDFDSEGNLWITNSEVSHSLHKLTPNGEWESYILSGIANSTVGQVLVNENDDKWVLAPRGNDAYVVDNTGDGKRRLLVTSYFSNGSDEYTTRMNDVYTIAEDKDGAIWIGASNGVAVYNNPSRIWDSQSFYASQPGLDLNDGIYHPLLANEVVTAIEVDGANRKWLGTSNSGVYLVSESGEEEIAHFTAENSPLLSNNIKAIAVDEKSGEVFFATENGLISYQGDAIGGKDNYEDVYVYPNPVRETYDGPVTITGLISETDVKITDIAGNLVYKTTSLGGQAAWDGKNLNGNRVKTGVYLVFCNDKLGNETQITKLLFIH